MAASLAPPSMPLRRCVKDLGTRNLKPGTPHFPSKHFPHNMRPNQRMWLRSARYSLSEHRHGILSKTFERDTR
jgi:hypothetical protein